MCDGDLQFPNKKPIQYYLRIKFDAVSRILTEEVGNAVTGNMSTYGCISALATPIIEITWNFIDTNYKL